MLLAAGRGTRLGPLGRTIPKALVEVGGRPLLARQLDYLAAHGVRDVVVNAHHLADQIVVYVKHARLPCAVRVIVEPELLGSAGGLRNAQAHLDPEQPVLVLNADTLLAAPLEEVAGMHLAAGADLTIATSYVPDVSGKGVVTAAPDGTVTAFVEKPLTGGPGHVNAGLYVFSHRAIGLVEPGEIADIALDLVPRVLAAGRVRAHLLEAAPLDIGTPETLAAARVSHAA
jgi:NDP-sugar pyrophosphorylase family protein